MGEKRQSKKPSRAQRHKRGREKCVPRRSADQQGIEERVKTPQRVNRETGGTPREEKIAPARQGMHKNEGRTPRRGHSHKLRHHGTNNTTTRGRGREGGTRAAEEGRRHHQPRHHGTNRTTTHPQKHTDTTATTHTYTLPARTTGGTPTSTPTPAQPRPQQVGGGPCLPAPRTGSRERTSA